MNPIFFINNSCHAKQWLVASIFVLTIGMSMAELASAAPTSGGVRDDPFCENDNFSNINISSTFGRTRFPLHVGEIYSAG